MHPNPYTAPTEISRRNGETNPEDGRKREPFPGCAVVFFLLTGAVGAFLGLAWIRTFGFTNYRAHLAYVGLPLGIITLLFSLVFLWFGVSILRRHANRDGP
jgi:hypothetical protein